MTKLNRGAAAFAGILAIALTSSCTRRDVSAKSNDSTTSEAQEVGTAIVRLRPIAQRLTLSSELLKVATVVRKNPGTGN